jgi:hypothetical protein
VLIQIKPAGLISQTWLTIPVRNRDTKNDTDTVPQTEITRALLLSCGLHRGECGAAAHQTPFNSQGRPWRGANIRLCQTPKKRTASDPYSDVCDHSRLWQKTTPTPLPKIDNKRTGIFKSNYHISVFFSAYIIWATEKVINWKKQIDSVKLQSQSQGYGHLHQRDSLPRLHLLRTQALLCWRLQVPKYKYYEALFWYLCPEAKIRPRKHTTIKDFLRRVQEHRLLQQQTAENVIKLDCYQPQYSQAYSTRWKKPRTARHKNLPAVWVQSFGIWSRDDWQKVT